MGPQAPANRSVSKEVEAAPVEKVLELELHDVQNYNGFDM